MILADSRYNRQDKRSKFPAWITQFVTESSLNLSTEIAVAQVKTFLREMGQPIDDDILHTILMTEDQVKKRGIQQSLILSHNLESNDSIADIDIII